MEYINQDKRSGYKPTPRRVKGKPGAWDNGPGKMAIRTNGLSPSSRRSREGTNYCPSHHATQTKNISGEFNLCRRQTIRPANFSTDGSPCTRLAALPKKTPPNRTVLLIKRNGCYQTLFFSKATNIITQPATKNAKMQAIRLPLVIAEIIAGK